MAFHMDNLLFYIVILNLDMALGFHYDKNGLWVFFYETLTLISLGPSSNHESTVIALGL